VTFSEQHDHIMRTLGADPGEIEPHWGVIAAIRGQEFADALKIEWTLHQIERDAIKNGSSFQ
jgi:hypothetical protein